MHSILIDSDGNSRPVSFGRSDADIKGYALSELGYIHIRAVGRAVIVSFYPQLVRPVTMTNAFRVIVDLNPEYIFVYAHMTYPQSMIFTGIGAALDWIERLVTEGRDPKIPVARD